MRQFLRWYVAKYGRGRLTEHLARLPDGRASEIDLDQPNFGIVSSGWYPASTFHALVDEMLEQYSPEQRQSFAREAAKATIDATVKGVYRFLFEAIMTPDRYAKRAQQVFDRFYDAGTITKQVVARNVHLTRVVGWTSHHPVLCDVMLYTSEYVYGLLGCRNVTVKRLGCISRGDASCSYEIRWD